MDDQDEIGIEKLRVDPALMAQVLEHQARSRSGRDGSEITPRAAAG